MECVEHVSRLACFLSGLHKFSLAEIFFNQLKYFLVVSNCSVDCIDRTHRDGLLWKFYLRKCVHRSLDCVAGESLHKVGGQNRLNLIFGSRQLGKILNHANCKDCETHRDGVESVGHQLGSLRVAGKCLLHLRCELRAEFFALRAEHLPGR